MSVHSLFIVCNQFQRGVYSLVGSVAPDSFDTLHSYSNTFQMPFVTPWFPENIQTQPLDYALGVRPDYHQAIIDTIRFYNWKKIIYLYDSNDGNFRYFFEFIIIFSTLKYVVEHIQPLPKGLALSWAQWCHQAVLENKLLPSPHND